MAAFYHLAPESTGGRRAFQSKYLSRPVSGGAKMSRGAKSSALYPTSSGGRRAMPGAERATRNTTPGARGGRRAVSGGGKSNATLRGTVERVGEDGSLVVHFDGV